MNPDFRNCQAVLLGGWALWHSKTMRGMVVAWHDAEVEFSFKEHRKLVAMVSAGASVEKLAEEFNTSKKMILQKAAELGVQLMEPTAKRSKAPARASNPDSM